MYLLSLYIRYYISIQIIEIQSLLWYQSIKLLTHNFFDLFYISAFFFLLLSLSQWRPILLSNLFHLILASL
jgi:hypothetical protein